MASRRRSAPDPLWKRWGKKVWHVIDGPLAVGAIGAVWIGTNEFLLNNYLASNYDSIHSEWGKQGYRWIYEVGERIVAYSPIGILGYRKIENAIRGTGIGARIYIHRVAVVALFARLKDAVTAGGQLAGVRAAGGVHSIAVVALIRSVLGSVAAGRGLREVRNRGRGRGESGRDG